MDQRDLERGGEMLSKIHGDYGRAVLSGLDGISPELKDWVIGFVFGGIYARPQLDLKSRQLVTIAALVTREHGGSELKAHIRGGLNVGLKRAEIVEAIMQLAIYAGFPAAIQGLRVAAETFQELDAAGPE